jgi:hypothetical protein
MERHLLQIARSIIGLDGGSPISLVNVTLEDLGGINTDDDDDRAAVERIKADAEFARTGRTPRSFDRRKHEEGIWIVKDDKYDQITLTDGRHRFTAARELGLKQIWGRVQDAESREFIYHGWIPI